MAELSPEEVMRTRDDTKGRLFQVDGAKHVELSVWAETEFGSTGHREPFILTRGSVVVCELTQDGQLLVTRTGGPGT